MIVAVRNAWTDDSWANISWVDAIPDKPKGDYLAYFGDRIEPLFHLDTLVKFREREPIGVVREFDSIHTASPDFPAPLGYPKFRDDFFILKLNCAYGEKFLAEWRKDGDVSSLIWSMGSRPCDYPIEYFRIHCKATSMPPILWGE